MENYDPGFQKTARKGDVMLSGFNFGTGSSREQAATSLKFFGIQMVIAGSFSETYKRNAINNGFILLECPELISHLQEKHGTNFLTKVLDDKIEVFMSKSQLNYQGITYNLDTLGPVAQELILAGGLENWVKKSIN